MGGTYLDTSWRVALGWRAMGRLLAVGAVVAAALIAVLVVSGEGPNKPEEADAAAPAKSQPQTRAEKPADDISPNGTEPGGVRIRMKGLRFVPESVSVAKGEPVRFVNVDDVAHAIYEDLGATSGKTAALDSKRIEPGQTFTFTPSADGVVAFVCTLHPTVMQGQILVEEDAA
jgi:plastocyanin